MFLQVELMFEKSSQEFDLTINEREKKQNELVYLFIYLFINYLFIINWLIWTDFIQMRYI